MLNEDVLFVEERKIQITEYININKKATVNELSKYFKVSIATIRNDLRELEKTSLIMRTHGGAMVKSKSSQELDLSSRTYNIAAKQSIAKAALNFVDDEDTIILDSGTTIHELAKILHVKKDLTIITNDITCVSILEPNNFNIVMLGGVIHNGFHWTTGVHAQKMIQELSADKAFLSTGGISIERGLSVGLLSLSDIKSSMIKCAAQSILLCDNSKFEKHKLAKFANLSDIDILITDFIDNETRTSIEEYEVDVLLTDRSD